MVRSDASQEMDTEEPLHRTHEVDRDLCGKKAPKLRLDLVGRGEVDEIINVETHDEGNLRWRVGRIRRITDEFREDAGILGIGRQAEGVEDAGDLVVPMLRAAA